MKSLMVAVLGMLWAATATAQLAEPNQVGVRMGHVHLAVRDVDAQKQFWIGVMGGTKQTTRRHQPAASSIISASW